MNLQISIHNINSDFKINKKRIKELVEFVLSTENCLQAIVEVIFVDDNYITALNQQFLNSDLRTDVISFALSDQDSPELIGEIYINLDMVQDNAKELQIIFDDEKKRMVIHGLLHLIGYDDRSNDDKKIMTDKEDYYLDHFQDKNSSTNKF